MGPSITKFDLHKMKWRDRAVAVSALLGDTRAAYARPAQQAAPYDNQQKPQEIQG